MGKFVDLVRQYFRGGKTAPRTAETSQVQDTLQEPITRTPERRSFEKTAKLKKSPSPKNNN